MNNSNIIIRKLINSTIFEEINWMYIGKNKNSNIFFSVTNIYGNKYLITQINIYNNPFLNNVEIYMQNSKNGKKSYCKKISNIYSIKKLSLSILDAVFDSYVDDDDDNKEKFISLYKDLIKIYSKP
jgi:hypothetical protein